MLHIFISLTILLLSTVALKAEEILLPNKNNKVIINTKKESGQVYFNVLYKEGKKYVEVLHLSPLRIVRNDQQFSSHLKLVDKRNCNFVLNCAPNRDGLMDDNVVKRLAVVGEAYKN